MEAVTSRDAGGRADVLYVLCLLEAAFVLLGGVGEMLLMGGSPLYLLLPIVKMVLLLVIGAKVVTGRRWAIATLLILQLITLTGWVLQVGAGVLLAFVDFTVNLVGLITNVALPAAVAWLCLTLLRHPRVLATALAPPQDPYLPAPLVTSATTFVIEPQEMLPPAVAR